MHVGEYDCLALCAACGQCLYCSVMCSLKSNCPWLHDVAAPHHAIAYMHVHTTPRLTASFELFQTYCNAWARWLRLQEPDTPCSPTRDYTILYSCVIWYIAPWSTYVEVPYPFDIP